jgi:hypothetical protein
MFALIPPVELKMWPESSPAWESKTERWINLICLTDREYWMIYVGPGFLAIRMILLLTHPLPPSLPPDISTGDKQGDWEREMSCWRGRGRGRRWARSRIIYQALHTFGALFTKLLGGLIHTTFNDCRTKYSRTIRLLKINDKTEPKALVIVHAMTVCPPISSANIIIMFAR